MKSAKSNDDANDRVAASSHQSSTQNAPNSNASSPGTANEDNMKQAVYKYKDYAGSQSWSDDAASDIEQEPDTAKASNGGANGTPGTHGNKHQCQPAQAAANYSTANISAMRRRALEANRSLFGNANPLDLDSASSAIANSHIMRMQKFPAKLASILSRPEWNDIVTWMPHGRSWKVRSNVNKSIH